MRIGISDIETDALDHPARMWLCGGRVLGEKGVTRFENADRDEGQRQKAIAWYKSLDLIVGHNFIAYDAPNINRLLKERVIDPYKVIDTLIVSRLVDYDIRPVKGAKTPHSLDAWGHRVGVRKGSFKDFSALTDKMIEYWESDIDVTEAVFNRLKKYIYDPAWRDSLRVEHDLQIELTRTHYYGFAFDKELAERVLTSVLSRMQKLEDQFQVDFPPKLTLTNTLQYRKKADGEEYATVKTAKERHFMTKVSGSDLLCYDMIPFNPGSSRDRVDVLWDAGWGPYEKTKTHVEFGRMKVGQPYKKSVASMDSDFFNKKKEELGRYGWAVSEDNLNTLPDTAPEGAKALAQWLTLEGRRSSLVEWIGQVKADGRIHGKINHIGAWTGRCSHNDPNTANIASIFSGKVRTPVDAIKDEYDKTLRACWTVPKGSFLVGTDADGIQLRILADILIRHFNAHQYANAILQGKKEDNTDIHNVNRRALLLDHLTRDDAKTFIYAWLLRAGLPKIAAILRTSTALASKAKSNFERSIEGLSRLNKELIPYIAEQGYFTGYDGRRVPVPSEHKTLAGLLQNGESVLMKHSTRLWHKEARADGLRFKMVAFVHDEWQTELIGAKEEAERLAFLQRSALEKTGEELGFLIKTPGESKIGYNWADCH